MNRIAIAILGICLGGSPGFSQVTWTVNKPYPADVQWKFESSNTAQSTSFNPSPLRAISNDSTPKYRSGGMVGSSLQIDQASQGYYTTAGTSPYAGAGWVWMGFVWVNSLGKDQAILWNEDYTGPDRTSTIAGFALSIDPRGFIIARVGKGGSWQAGLTSGHVIGPYAWHHVAFAWTGTRIRLYLDGVLESSRDYRFTPDWAPRLTFGARNSYNQPASLLLDGALDEVKLVNFTLAEAPGTDAVNQNIVQHEYGIALRNRFLKDLAKVYDVQGRRDPINPDYPFRNRFASPTFDSTSEVRAAVNAMFTSARASLPVDPLSVQGSYMDYVYPVWGGKLFWDTNLKAYNSLYLNLNENGPQSTTPVHSGYCATASLMLWSIYRALGYEARRYDYVNGLDFEYDASHSMNDVYLSDYKKYVLQDATYNISGVVTLNGVPSALAVGELGTLFNDQNYSPSIFSDGGYKLNSDPNPTWNVMAPGVDYRDFFNMRTSIVPAFLQ